VDHLGAAPMGALRNLIRQADVMKAVSQDAGMGVHVDVGIPEPAGPLRIVWRQGMMMPASAAIPARIVERRHSGGSFSIAVRHAPAIAWTSRSGWLTLNRDLPRRPYLDMIEAGRGALCQQGPSPL